MNNLSEKMQQRLDKWRNKTTETTIKISYPATRNNGKGDYGDALSKEDWDEEIKKSQTRR